MRTFGEWDEVAPGSLQADLVAHCGESTEGFFNEARYPYCQREGIRFTRGRPYKKNDQAYVEQKNWSVVRRLVGYRRYSTRATN